MGDAVSKPLGSRYLLESALGRGVTGEVWRGSDRDGALLAFKVLHESLAGDAAIVQQNILLDTASEPSAPKLTESLTSRSTILVGTPHYLAPEMFDGQAPHNDPWLSY